MEPCGLCRRPFAHHLVLVAESKVRWRGTSFDAYQAQGKLGVAVARALGYETASREGFARFARDVSIRDFREKPGLTGSFEPGEHEAWEFHLGFAVDVPPEALARVEAEALAALRTIPNYVRVAPLREWQATATDA